MSDITGDDVAPVFSSMTAVRQTGLALWVYVTMCVLRCETNGTYANLHGTDLAKPQEPLYNALLMLLDSYVSRACSRKLSYGLRAWLSQRRASKPGTSY